MTKFGHYVDSESSSVLITLQVTIRDSLSCEMCRRLRFAQLNNKPIKYHVCSIISSNQDTAEFRLKF